MMSSKLLERACLGCGKLTYEDRVQMGIRVRLALRTDDWDRVPFGSDTLMFCPDQRCKAAAAQVRLTGEARWSTVIRGPR